MTNAISSLLKTGTKLWLDSVDPDLVLQNHKMGATGATSNPVIVSELIKTGRFDSQMSTLIAAGHDDSTIAWQLTDTLVGSAEKVFADIHKASKGNDGYVSFELDPLLEDPDAKLAHQARVDAYVELAKVWTKGHHNRMIKVPATPAGIDALEGIAALGIPLNVTLIFTARQYRAARDAVWKGAQRLGDLNSFKSVYSIFVSRLDVYADQHCQSLPTEAQGMLGILNAKRVWAENKEFWNAHPTPLDQEIVFASTGTKKKEDKPWKYVEAFAGGDVQTNPPGTNDAVAASDVTFKENLSSLPDSHIVQAIDRTVDLKHMEQTLMDDGIAKFVAPQKALLELIKSKR